MIDFGAPIFFFYSWDFHTVPTYELSRVRLWEKGGQPPIHLKKNCHNILHYKWRSVCLCHRRCRRLQIPDGAFNWITVLHAAQAIKNNKSEKEVYSKSLAGVKYFWCSIPTLPARMTLGIQGGSASCVVFLCFFCLTFVSKITRRSYHTGRQGITLELLVEQRRTEYRQKALANRKTGVVFE